MQRLRRAHQLARLVLAWFVLALGVAVVSPALGQVALELVCSEGAVKLQSTGDAAPVHAAALVAHCPACVHSAAPPPAQPALVSAGAPAPSVPAPAPQGLQSRPHFAPWTARGPPAFS